VLRQTNLKESMFTLTYRYGDTTPLPFDWLVRMSSTIAGLWTARLMIAEPQALDDWMLKEIGIHRCQTGSAVLTPRIAKAPKMRHNRARHACILGIVQCISDRFRRVSPALTEFRRLSMFRRQRGVLPRFGTSEQRSNALWRRT
jgi:hypothetical protein